MVSRYHKQIGNCSTIHILDLTIFVMPNITFFMHLARPGNHES